VMVLRQSCVDVLNGVKMAFTGLVGLSSIGKSARNGVDYTSDLLFLWRLSLAPLLLLSLSTSIFCSVSSFFFFFLRRDSYVAPLGVLRVSLLLGGCPTS